VYGENSPLPLTFGGHVGISPSDYPLEKIGSVYPSMSMIVIATRSYTKTKDDTVWCLMFIDCLMFDAYVIKIPGTHF
jgi:hypothetical protein